MNFTVIAVSTAILLVVLAFIIYKYTKSKSYKFSIKKLISKVSIVIVTKNNEVLIEHAIKTVLKQDYNINEIIVLDKGSIDRTVDIAHKLLGNDKRSKILTILSKTITDNYFNILSSFVTGESVLVLDLHRVSLSNPNIYIPDLFKPIAFDITDKTPVVDERIDGTKLLSIFSAEREKDYYILNKHVIEPLNIIQTNVHTIIENMQSDQYAMSEKTADIENYIEKIIRDITLISRLMRPGKIFDKPLEESILNLFKEYGQSYNVSIEYKVYGSIKILKEQVNSLMLEVIQDLLYTVIHYNLSSEIKALCKYSHKAYRILINYNCICDEKTLLNPDSGLSYFELNCIQSRLNLIGGNLKLRVKPKWRVNILLEIPLEHNLIGC